MPGSKSVILVVAVSFFLLGDWNGRQSGHMVVADDCEKLGAFYVGDRVFACSLKPPGAIANKEGGR